MNNKTLRIAILQLKTEPVWEDTMAKAERMLSRCAEDGADIAVLPEMFNCPYDKKYFRAFAENDNGRSEEYLSAWAKKLGIYIVGGTVPEKDGDSLYNTCFVYDRGGRQIARHRKAHLFDVNIEGGVRFMESKSFSAGNEITVFDTEFGKMGVLVCFDMRFPEMVRAMAKRGAQIVFCPAQFNMTTGPLHWELTIRARAMDNELYFAAASAARNEEFSYVCWGHSTVAGPFGNIEASCDEREQLLYCDIDLSAVDSVRAQLPTFLRLREELYDVAK